ncbi:hypothetical protein Mpt1_c06290 [Candidatus Methanoplasma termitum]|uniref:CxxC-x17-CxxC domain-containing protein n=1 Tax=Candidatus Methanoplasma termitum TaxID=1577791 RepID=A0A0A7LBI8_9ARCH|nr:CxxC-x17-CxxC domain-containing protein [Candidatus Methanoplasma termitum]AIZ56515.1 hypothetical protein Mpt1_c06290 [Candidatus Methanoplasma termitum]MCL2333252.1 hypothetical protein [Candidatus Methanoplasma sp.]
MAYGNSGGGYRGGGDRRDQPKEYFKTKCSDCSAECEVPFKPTQGRPVYCRDCFKKHQPEGGRSNDRRRF